MPASKKLYESMALTIRRHAEMCRFTDIHLFRALAKDLCDDLKQDNMRFDREKFLEACNLAY